MGSIQEIEILPDGGRVESGFSIDFQAKATINMELRGDYYYYDLEVKNYKHLIKEGTPIPRILIVYKITDPAEYVTVSAQNTVLQGCAWWCSLKGLQDTTNTGTIRIKIPKDQIFNQENLKRMMEIVSKGGELYVAREE